MNYRFFSHWKHRDLFWLMLAALVVLAAGLGLRAPWPADEPRFVLIAKTMIESGDYLFPHRGQELYPDKPPMFMWILAATYRVVGNWNVAFLLPSLLAGLGTIYLTFDLALRLWGRRAAIAATWMLLFTAQFTYQLKRAQIDPVLVFLITLSCYALLRHMLLQASRKWYAVAFFAAGIGTITKGVGIVALLMLPAYFIARRYGAQHLATMPGSALRWWMGLPWLLLAIAIWLVPMLLAVAQSDDPLLHDYARNILLGQTAQRFVHPSHHLHPWWYFLQVIAVAWLPLSLLLPWSLPALIRRWRRRRDARFFLPAFWALMVVVFFSLSPGKRDMYILPALPMLCVAIAPGLQLALRRTVCRRLLLAFSTLLALVFLCAGLAALLGEPSFERKLELSHSLVEAGDAHWWMILTLGSIAALGALVFRARYAWAGTRLALAGIWIIGLVYWGYPLLDSAKSASGVMRRAGAIIGPHAELGLLGWREQNLLQADRTAVEFGHRRPIKEQRTLAVAWLAKAPDRRWLFANATALNGCFEPAAVIRVGTANSREWVLLRWSAVRMECRP